MSGLTHALWIGGPPRSVKTTIATRLARRHGLRWYNADARTWEHRDRALQAGHRAAHRWEAMTPDERWAHPTPAEIEELTLVAERGPMIVEDVRQLPASPLTVAEGTPLRPSVVVRAGVGPSRSVWLVPTTEVVRARIDERGARGDVNDPRRAHENAIRLALLEAAEIELEARQHGLTVLPDDGTRGIDDTVAEVEHLFAEALAEGPLAGTVAERRELLRSANAAVVAQVHAYCARPWANVPVEAVVRTFLCECGDPGCDAVVELRVADFPHEPVLGPGHGAPD